MSAGAWGTVHRSAGVQRIDIARQWPWLVIGVVFLALRLPIDPAAQNIDEYIPLSVARGMSERGDLDPNWAIAPGMPGMFQIPSYGFSSYLLLAFPFLDASPDAFDLITLRWLNTALQAGALALIYLGLRRLEWRRGTALLAVGLLAIAPALVHDNHMARPESLLYLLFAVLFYVACGRRLPFAAALVAGAAVGFGTATKATFLLSLIIAIPAFWREARADVRRAATLAGAGAAGVLAGFMLGAPYALIHPDVFVSGVDALMKQYAGAQVPYSMPDYSFLAQAGWMGWLLLLLYGPVVVAAPAATAARDRSPMNLALAALALVTFFYFATQQTFFERNLCLAVVCMIVLTARLAERAGRFSVVAAALAATPMLWWSAQIALQSNFDWDGRKDWQARTLALPLRVVDSRTYENPASGCAGTIGMPHYKHPVYDADIRKLESLGYRRINGFHGLFHILPISTLDSYLSPDFVYFACAQKLPRDVLVAEGPTEVRFMPGALGLGLLAKGWGPPEDFGVWGNVKQMKLSLPPVVAGKPVRSLGLETLVFAPPGVTQTVVIRTRGRVIARKAVKPVRDPATQAVSLMLDLPEDAATGGSIVLEVSVDNPRRPVDAGLGKDTRWLALGLSKLTFNPPAGGAVDAR